MQAATVQRGEEEKAQKARRESRAMCDLRTQKVICGHQATVLRRETHAALCLAFKRKRSL